MGLLSQHLGGGGRRTGRSRLSSKFETSLSCVSKQTKDRKKRKKRDEGGKEGKREVHETDRHRGRCFGSLLCMFLRVPSNGIHTRD